MTEAEITAYEAKLAAMTPDELLAANDAAEVESEELDLIAGELERRGLDG